MVEAGYAGSKVKTSGSEFYVLLIIVLGIVAIVVYYLRKGLLAIPDIPGAIAKVASDVYTGKETQAERYINYQERWIQSDVVLASAKELGVFCPTNPSLLSGDARCKYITTVPWLDEPQVAIASLTSEEYAARKAEAETWMTKYGSDYGITAPYGSAAYQQWAENNPLLAQEYISFWDRTAKENIDYGTAKIYSWWDSW